LNYQIAIGCMGSRWCKTRKHSAQTSNYAKHDGPAVVVSVSVEIHCWVAPKKEREVK
jgi:hypothetical protein